MMSFGERSEVKWSREGGRGKGKIKHDARSFACMCVACKRVVVSIPLIFDIFPIVARVEVEVVVVELDQNKLAHSIVMQSNTIPSHSFPSLCESTVKLGFPFIFLERTRGRLD